MSGTDIYAWLYDHYAAPELDALDEGRQAALVEFAARLGMSQINRRRLLDLMENIRIEWGTESFAMGVRFGLDLAAPRACQGDPAGLLHFLPQLDQPVP